MHRDESVVYGEVMQGLIYEYYLNVSRVRIFIYAYIYTYIYTYIFI